MGFGLAVGSALWLGILTSISPCPLASNVAAIAFLGRGLGHPTRVLLAGMAYSTGRAVTYVLVATVVATSLLSIPSLSMFLQQQMSRILGPALIIIGVVLSGRIRIAVPSWTRDGAAEKRAERAGVVGAAGLGMLFALSFCPVSAGLFFGALLPLALGANSKFLIPAVFGVGTGLPVIAFAFILALGLQWAGRAFNLLTAIERIARPATAVILVLAGVYLSIRHFM